MDFAENLIPHVHQQWELSTAPYSLSLFFVHNLPPDYSTCPVSTNTTSLLVIPQPPFYKLKHSIHPMAMFLMEGRKGMICTANRRANFPTFVKLCSSFGPGLKFRCFCCEGDLEWTMPPLQHLDWRGKYLGWHLFVVFVFPSHTFALWYFLLLHFCMLSLSNSSFLPRSPFASSLKGVVGFSHAQLLSKVIKRFNTVT